MFFKLTHSVDTLEHASLFKQTQRYTQRIALVFLSFLRFCLPLVIVSDISLILKRSTNLSLVRKCGEVCRGIVAFLLCNIVLESLGRSVLSVAFSDFLQRF